MSATPPSEKLEWQPDPAHVATAATAAGRFIQGSILRIPGLLWMSVDGRPLTYAAATQPDRKDDDSLMAIFGTLNRTSVDNDPNSGRAMLVTQSCDIARPGGAKNLRPFVMICAVVQIPIKVRIVRKRDSFPNLVDIDWSPTAPAEGHTWVADLSLTTTLERSVLVSAAEIGRPINDARRRLSDSIARYFGRPGFPDWMSEFMAPVTEMVTKGADAHTAFGRIVDDFLHDVRISADPDFDDPGPYSIVVTLVPDENVRSDDNPRIDHDSASKEDVDAASEHLVSILERPTSTDDQDLVDAWINWGQVLFGNTHASLGVRELTIRLAGRLSPDEYWRSESLDLRYLSALDPRKLLKETVSGA